MNDYWNVSLVVSGLASTALGVIWHARVRAAKRWLAVLDALAEREIAEQRPKQALNQAPKFATALGVSRKLRASATAVVGERR